MKGNVAETCETVPETRRITGVYVSAFVTFTPVSVAAYTAEHDHFFLKCLRSRNSEVAFAETQEIVAEICLFHVSVDVFGLLLHIKMCDGTSGNTRHHLLAFVSQTWYFKVIFYLREVNIFLFSCFLKRTFIMCMAGRESS